MFQQGKLFKGIVCPENSTCKRPYCSFKHPVKPPPPVPAKLPAAVPRKLPSYAPQSSPAQPKVTVDYKQIIKKKPALNNVFDKLRGGPISISNSFSRKKQQQQKPVQKSSNLFEKFALPPKPPVVHITDEKEGEFSDDEKKEVKDKEDEEYCPMPQYSQQSETSDASDDLVYTPGVGLTSSKPVNNNNNTPAKPEYKPDVVKPVVAAPKKEDPPKPVLSNGKKKPSLNCSVDNFDDPYSTADVPFTTSPSRVTHVSDDSELPDVFAEDEVLLSDGEEEEEEEEESVIEEKPPYSRNESSGDEITVVKQVKHEVKVVEKKKPSPPPPASPVKAPVVAKPSLFEKLQRQKQADLEDDVFGPSSPTPVPAWKKKAAATFNESPAATKTDKDTSPNGKYRKTFQKKRNRETIKLGSWMEGEEMEEEEDEIMTREFQKDLEEQQRRFQEEFGGSSSEDETKKEIRRIERLEAIKNLKAKIWEKQYKKTIKKGTEEGSTSSSSDQDSSSSSSGTESSSDIDSSDSVTSIGSHPKRKRKRLSSPLRSPENRPSTSSRTSLDEKSASSIRKLHQKHHTIRIEKPRKKLKPGAERLMKAESIIPHHMKKKKNDLERRKHSSASSNSKNFYGNTKSSKYKREELSHFDPPTPPSEDDPHRFASSHKKNRKRVAHHANTKATFKTETKPSETKIPIRHPGGPRIDLKERAIIPPSARQVRLDFFITEYLKLWPDNRPKCFAEGYV
eukprot:sb/3462447/